MGQPTFKADILQLYLSGNTLNANTNTARGCHLNDYKSSQTDVRD